MAQLVTIKKPPNVAQLITSQHAYIYMYVYVYVYIYICMHAVVFDNGVLSSSSFVRKCSRACVQESSLLFRQPSEIEALETDFWFWRPESAFRVAVGATLAFFVGAKDAQNCGEKRVLGFLTPKSTHHTKKWALEQKAEIYFSGRAHSHLCVFVWRAWISPKTGFENRTNFAETTENVVPKWRGQKRSFCTGGSKKAILELRSGSKMVPIHFSFHCTSFPIYLQEHKENYLMFLDFSLLENMSLLSF